MNPLVLSGALHIRTRFARLNIEVVFEMRINLEPFITGDPTSSSNSSADHPRLDASRDNDRGADHEGDHRADDHAAADTDLHAGDRLQDAAESP